MKYALVALLGALFLFLSPARAQTSFSSDTTEFEPVASERSADPCADCGGGRRGSFRFVRYKWDVSVDASFVLPRFVNLTYAPYGGGYNTYGTGLNQTGNFTRFMVRKNEVVRDSRNIPVRKGAYRLNVGFGLSGNKVREDSIKILSANTYLIENASSFSGVSVDAGYEWQQQLGRFQLLYGYEGFVRYSHSNTTGHFYYLGLNDNQEIEQKREQAKWSSSSLSIGIAPLAGLKFFVHPRFSVSVENKLYIQYNRNQDKANHATLSLNGLSRYSLTSGYATTLAPLSALNATFHFGQVVR
ncbi:hypothetical protein [Hymenobacter sp. B81]|uniref:hypothetical protein n=1 Tax=Hymenobacter sp. B81 TaxID=3344878 RepID=UPI0037DC8E41